LIAASRLTRANTIKSIPTHDALSSRYLAYVEKGEIERGKKFPEYRGEEKERVG